MISPQTWLEPPVGPNVLAERPAFPTRALRVLAREMASAIGATDCSELNDDADVQRIAANTIYAYMAKTVMDRAHARLLQVADRLSTGEFGLIALVDLVAHIAVLYTMPAPPPLMAVVN